MPGFLLSTGTWGPLGRRTGCHSATWFRYKNHGTLQTDDQLDKFELPEPLIRSSMELRDGVEPLTAKASTRGPSSQGNGPSTPTMPNPPSSSRQRSDAGLKAPRHGWRS